LENGEVDFPEIKHHVDELVAQGCVGAFVAGTTGEGVTMSVSERKKLLETWIHHAEGRLQIIAHIAADSITDVLDLAYHAESVKVNAIAAHPSAFNKPANLDAIVDWIAHISITAPSTPFYYYHISVKNGVFIRCDQLLEKLHASRARVPTFVGIKFTDFDLHILANCLAFENGEYNILSGRDEVVLGALVMGATGAVGSTYNYMGRVYNDLLKAFNEGNMTKARELQRVAQKGVDILLDGAAYGNGVNVGKEIMAVRMKKPSVYCRYPGTKFTPEARAKLEKALAEIHFDSY
jgi:N-acetylneuraminate lyase